MTAPAKLAPRFTNVSCSQCGQDFGPGDSGYSHCSDHRKAAAKHTPGPVFLDRRSDGDINVATILGERGNFVVATVMTERGELDPVDRANAERIVLCWNVHDEMLDLLKQARPLFLPGSHAELLMRVQAVIAKAGGA